MEYPLNKVGIRILEAVRPAEQFCIVYAGTADNFKGVKYQPAAFPSRLKHTD